MLLHPTVLLRHEAGASVHHDWMLLDPTLAASASSAGADDRVLWTARVQPASDCWRSMAQWDVEPIAHHRRAFLTYEGPLSGRRGSVVRVDEGEFAVRAWGVEGIEIELTMWRFGGPCLVRIDPTGGPLWRARVVEDGIGHR